MAKKVGPQKVGRDSQSGKFIPTKDTGKTVRNDEATKHRRDGGETESTGPKKK